MQFHVSWQLSWAEAFGFAGSALSICTYSMRMMVPLRISAIAANCVLLAYASGLGLYPTLLTNSVLLPLNIWRLTQMLRLTRRVREAARDKDLSLAWLRPFMNRRRFRAGELLFRKGDPAESMLYTVGGRFRLQESGMEFQAGTVLGELGLFAPDGQRTQTLVCVEEGEALVITYDEVRQLCFQNPDFGFYFMRLATSRLFENLAAAERQNPPAAKQQDLPVADPQTLPAAARQLPDAAERQRSDGAERDGPNQANRRLLTTPVVAGRDAGPAPGYPADITPARPTSAGLRDGEGSTPAALRRDAEPTRPALHA